MIFKMEAASICHVEEIKNTETIVRTVGIML